MAHIYIFILYNINISGYVWLCKQVHAHACTCLHVPVQTCGLMNIQSRIHTIRPYLCMAISDKHVLSLQYNGKYHAHMNKDFYDLY